MIKYLLSVRLIFRFSFTILYLILIVALSLMPPNDLPKVKLFEGFDKIVHFLMYCPLAVLLCWNFKTEQNGYRIFWVFFGTILWGIFMEFMQLTMHLGRTFSWYDELANFVGVVVGIILYWSITKKITFQK